MSYSWQLICAPLLFLAILWLCVSLCVPLCTPSPFADALGLSLPARTALGLASLSTIAFSLKIAAPAHSAALGLTWSVALLPCVVWLLFCGARLVVVGRQGFSQLKPPRAAGGTDLLKDLLLQLVELVLAAVALWLLNAKLSSPPPSGESATGGGKVAAGGGVAARGGGASWWLVAAPLLALLLLQLVAGCAICGGVALSGAAAVTENDRADALLRREAAALRRGGGLICGSLLLACAISTLASTMEAPSPLHWRAAYAPYFLPLSLLACCCCCCSFPFPFRTAARAAAAAEPARDAGGAFGSAAAAPPERSQPRGRRSAREGKEADCAGLLDARAVRSDDPLV